MEQSVEGKEKLTFSDLLRYIFRKPLERIGTFLHKLGIKPNFITFLGVVGVFVGAVFVGLGELLLGGIILIVMSGVDVLDGAVARAGGEPEDFGAFVDSVSDRYSELIIFGSLMWYFVEVGNYTMAVVTFVAASGSVLVSYTRARAQSLGFEAKIGIMSRFVRLMALLPTIALSVPQIGVSLVAIFANVTAVQRIVHVRGQARKQKLEQND